jgi:hypothetical protein
MSRKLPHEFYRAISEVFSDQEFMFDQRLLDAGSTWMYLRYNLTNDFINHYPEFVSHGMYKPFMEIPELRQFGEDLIRMQSSPLWKAMS